MGRDRFLRLLEEFDNNYSPYIAKTKKWHNEELEKEKVCNKQYHKQTNCKNLFLFSQIDYLKIKIITSKEKNPFKVFYKLSNEDLEIFFKTLHLTHYLLVFEPTYMTSKRDRGILYRKIQDVIEYLETLGGYGRTTIETLNKIGNELIEEKIFLTKRRIFENLLFDIFMLLESESPKLDKRPLYCTQKIATITNEIIKEYFHEDSNFSRKINFSTFTTITYNAFRKADYFKDNIDYEIKLFHSK